ncbi:hypothetical protein E4T49_08187 [Aureobasidium sp. EXF-10728]|nr:hypothetical protein E4T49_08187 [Aureobasidium sp. EXF-10728]
MAPNSQIEMNNLPVDRSAGFHQKVVDGIEDLLLVLAEDGRVLYASPKSFSLIQIKPEALVGHYISTYMNVDDIPVFLIEWKENMALGSSWRSHHRLRQGDDTYKPFESTFKPYTKDVVHDKTGSKTDTKLCLMTSRPYQITSTSLMDSFLEHYTTNIRLTNQLAWLKGEAEEFYESTISTTTACTQEDDATVQCATFKLEITTANATTNNRDCDSDATFCLHTSHALASIRQLTRIKQPSTKASNSNIPSTTLSVSGSLESRSKRSLSESTTSTKPQTDSVVGDIGIEITTSRLQTMKETGAWTAKPRTKKRKQEVGHDYLCKECGTTNSPEWRRGPLGSKTLCNACGLRWSKAQKEPTSLQMKDEPSQ